MPDRATPDRTRAAPAHLLAAVALALTACATAPRADRCWATPLPIDGFVAADAVARPDGTLVFAGTWRTGARGDGGLVSVDGARRQAWRQTFGGDAEDSLSAMAADPAGRLILVGTTASAGEGDGDVWLVLTGPDGARVAERTFGGPYPDSGADVVLLADGSAVLVGTTASSGPGRQSGWLARVDAAGGETWSLATGLCDVQDLRAAALAGADVVAVGSALSDGRARPWAVRVAADGKIAWQTLLAVEDDLEPLAVAGLSDGRVAVAGRRGLRASLVVLSGDGAPVASRDYGPPRSGQSIDALWPAPDGGFLLAGTLIRPAERFAAFYLIGAGPDLAPRWSAVLGGGLPLAVALAPNTDGLVLIGSSSADERFRVLAMPLDATRAPAVPMSAPKARPRAGNEPRVPLRLRPTHRT